ncbi:MAG: Isochorismatase [uncultured bacterium]|nr:MAG: Isochorismatase [uncultured bacterium]
MTIMPDSSASLIWMFNQLFYNISKGVSVKRIFLIPLFLFIIFPTLIFSENAQPAAGAVKKALIVIDLQNDYFPGGKYPLWNAENTLNNVLAAIKTAQAKGVTIIHVQHVAGSKMAVAPFFNEGTEGVAIHSKILQAAPDAPVVVKKFADSFHETNLEETLKSLGITELFVCGMMTQNCVTHTAISKSAEKYQVTVLMDCCTTVDEMIHNIALSALSTRVAIVTSDKAF